MWPGFGENARVLEWIFKRSEMSGGDENLAVKAPIGYLPSSGGIDVSGLQEEVDMEGLFHLPKDFWQTEVGEIRKYFDEQVNDDLPSEISEELDQLSKRLENL